MGIQKALNNVGKNYAAIRSNNINSSNQNLANLLMTVISEIKKTEVFANYPNIDITFSKGASRYPIKPTFYIKDKRETNKGTKGVYLVITIDPVTYKENPHFTFYLTQGLEGLNQITDPAIKKSKLDFLQLKAKKIATSFIPTNVRESQQGFSYADKGDVGGNVYIAKKIVNFPSFDKSIIQDLGYLASLYDQYVESTKASNDGDRVFRLMEVEVRTKQAAFKKQLLNHYKQCVVTGCTVESALDAAHILPHSKFVNFDVANGFIMRADIHRLYDAHLLTINKNGKIILDKSLRKDPTYKQLNKKFDVNPASATLIQARLNYK